jgi:hypothetical protein
VGAARPDHARGTVNFATSFEPQGGSPEHSADTVRRGRGRFPDRLVAALATDGTLVGERRVVSGSHSIATGFSLAGLGRCQQLVSRAWQAPLLIAFCLA